LDIIGEDIFNSYKNVVMAETELDEANQLQKKSRRKYFVFTLFLLIIVAVVLFLIFGL
jgi:t-SNARE complex subunit (syntaxin)